MKVFLLKDIEKVGMAGEMIQVSEGYGRNFLIPRKLALEVSPSEEKSFSKRALSVDKRHEVIESKLSLLAERLKNVVITVTRKIHDGDKLYAAITPADVVALLAAQGFEVEKHQVLIDKAIKKAGVFPITIKLSPRFQPVVSLKIVAEAV